MESEKHSEACPFCNISDERIVAENQLCLAFYDGFPVSPGHLLIVPRRHVADFFELTREEVAAVHDLLSELKAMLDVERHPDGYNVGVNVNRAAGQSVFHVHVHLIPRYFGDMENPKGGVRGVIPGKMKY